MPQTKSCKKRMKQNTVRRDRNRAGRSGLRRIIRQYRELAPGDRAGVYQSLSSTLDKAASKGLISKNRASRLKSRLCPTA